MFWVIIDVLVHNFPHTLPSGVAQEYRGIVTSCQQEGASANVISWKDRVLQKITILRRSREPFDVTFRQMVKYYLVKKRTTPHRGEKGETRRLNWYLTRCDMGLTRYN